MSNEKSNDKFLFHKRLLNWEVYDKIEIAVVPRYKTSGLSGDEWRTSVYVKMFFKGVVVTEFSCRDMSVAMWMLPAKFHGWDSIPKKVLMAEASICDQPGCPQRAVGRLLLRRETDEHGDYLEDRKVGKLYRQFCLNHIERGDSSREDSDDNYESLDKIDRQDTQNAEESPASFGGIIDISELEKP